MAEFTDSVPPCVIREATLRQRHGYQMENGWHNSSGLTSSMTLTQVREPPHVSNANAEAHTGEDVLGFVVPLGPVLGLHPLQILIGRNPFLQSWVRENQLHCDSDEAEMVRDRPQMPAGGTRVSSRVS